MIGLYPGQRHSQTVTELAWGGIFGGWLGGAAAWPFNRSVFSGGLIHLVCLTSVSWCIKDISFASLNPTTRKSPSLSSFSLFLFYTAPSHLRTIPSSCYTIPFYRVSHHNVPFSCC